MSKFGFATATLLTAAIAASCAAAPAVADPAPGTICDPNPATNAGYDASFCAKWTEPATPTSHHGVSGLGDWFSDHAGPLIAVVVVGLIIAVAASVARDRREEAAAEQRAVLARGRRIAQDHYAAMVQRVRDAAAQLAPDPSVYDPYGLGVARPSMPEPELPTPPSMADVDLKRYAAFGVVTDWIPGTAFAAVVGRDGSIAPARQAWAEACRAARMGDVDEDGDFIPHSTLVQVSNVPGGGDVELTIRPRDLFIGEPQLDKVTPFLLRTARVLTAGKFHRDHAADEFTVTLSNTATAATPESAAPAAVEQSTVDPKWS